MKHFLFVLLLALAVAVIAVPAYAQQDITKVTVPFGFTAGKTVMPAGTYELKADPNTEMITITPQRGKAIAVPAITRLAERTKIQDAELVFDKIEDTYYLSEFWMPMNDGYLIRDTKQPHKHHVLKGEKKTTT